MSRRKSLVLAVMPLFLAVQGCSPPSGDNASTSPSTPLSVESSTESPPSPAPPPTQGRKPDSPAVWEVVGTSVQGKQIRLMTIGHGPRKVLFIGGIHGDEPEGVVTTAELPGAFEAAGLADRVTLSILEDANPDGRAARTRGNANGIDVNRNFPASNFDGADPSNGGKALSEPESRAVYHTVDRLKPDLILVAHSWTGRQFINFDGPSREIAERFSASSGLRVEESNSFAPTPGSLGSCFGRDRGIPVLTIEVLKGSDPAAVWEQLRDALLQSISG